MTKSKETAAAKKAKMTKFQQILTLTGVDVLDKRSTILVNATKSKVNAKLQELYDQRDDLELQMLQLEDLSIGSKNNLRPGGKDFNPARWVDECLAVRGQLADLALEIETAEEFRDEYFGVPVVESEA